MTALPRNQYSTALSLDGLGSLASPSRSGHMHATFKPIPLAAFTVVVSIVPADQLTLRQHFSVPSASANLALEGVGGAAGVGGPPCMAGSIAANGAVAGNGASPSMPGFLSSSCSPSNSSFALTKSFGDVFALKKAAGGGSGGNGQLASSGRANNSFGSPQSISSSPSAVAAAASAVKGLADSSVMETPVPNSQDSYRVHLLLPADYQRHNPTASLTHASSTLANSSSRWKTSLYSSVTPSAGDNNDSCCNGLSAATSSLEALHTAKRKQAVQVNEHWVLFQQLVRFVLSVAPRFEPPATPPGFAFPVDLGLSFVQNSSIFSAAEATQQTANGLGPPLPVPGVPLGGPYSSLANSPKIEADDPVVRGDEREARRAYMEAYLNSAIQCDQVNCLKELQAFVGYDTYVKNELAHFRVMSRTLSNGSFTRSPAAGFPNRNNNVSQYIMVGSGSSSEFSNRGPLGGSSHSASSRSQHTVSTTPTASHRARSNVGAPVNAASAPESTDRLVVAATANSHAPSSRTSEVSVPPAAGAFSVTSLHPLDDPQRFSSNYNNAAIATVINMNTIAATTGTPVGSSTPHSNSGSADSRSVVGAIYFPEAKALLAPSRPGFSSVGGNVPSSVLSDGSRLQQGLKKTCTASSPGTTAGALLSINGSRQDNGPSRLLTENAFALAGNVAAFAAAESSMSAQLAAKPLTPSHDSSGSLHHHHQNHPLASSAQSSSSQSPSASASLLLGAVEGDNRRSNNDSTNYHRNRKEMGKNNDAGSCTSSSPSVDSSFGSSVSHPGGARRRHHRRCHHRSREHRHRDKKRHERRRGRDERGGDHENEAGGVEVAAAAAPAATPASTTSTSRTDLKSLVFIAPETERMLTECFRMMDTEGRGYVSAADCLPFYLCATADTFAETLCLFTNAANLADEKSIADAAGRTRWIAQLEALLPAWMRDCESVVVGNPDYLMSCARFVAAVQEILVVSAAMELTSAAAAVAPAGGANGGTNVTVPMQPHIKVQTSAGNTPASSAPSPGGPTMARTSLAGSGGTLGSRDGRCHEEAAPLPLHPVDTIEGTAGEVGSAPLHSLTGSVLAEEADNFSTAMVTKAVISTPIESLESWIDNYWLLMYSHLFTAVSVLVVGAEAEGLRAALLDIREKAYLEMAAQVATAVAVATECRRGDQKPALSPVAVVDVNSTSMEVAQASASPPDRTAGGALLSLELVYPPWLLREVAAALAAQPPILGCFDALELLSLVYVICESGISVVGVEDVLQWLGTRTCQPSTRFSLDEFASMLDVLSCSLPFADVLHCVRRQWRSSTISEKEEGENDGAGTSNYTSKGAKEKILGKTVLSPQQHAHLLRLMSRCAITDPTGGREFNELVQQQRWRRGGGVYAGGMADESGRTCEQCQLARGVLEQQAVLLETLQEENSKLQKRIAVLEAAAKKAVAETRNVTTPAGLTTRTMPNGTTPGDMIDSTTAPPRPASYTADAVAAAGVSARLKEVKKNTLVSPINDGAQLLDADVLANTREETSSASPTLTEKKSTDTGIATAAITSTTTTVNSASPPSHHTMHRATVELMPVYTAEGGAGDTPTTLDCRRCSVAAAAGDGDDDNNACGRHRSSKQTRTVATQVARAGPLLYTVPVKYARRQPKELEWTFYLCRAVPREEEKNRGANAVSGASSGVGGASFSAPAVERLTVRDSAGRRVIAFKLSNNVLHILGRDVVQRPAHLPFVTAPLPLKSSHHSLHGASAFASPTTPVRRHLESQNLHERQNVNSVLGREQNILYPSYEDSDWDGRNNPCSFMYRGNALGSSSIIAAPHSTFNHLGSDAIAGDGWSGGRAATLSDKRFPTVTMRTGTEYALPQRVVSRVKLQAHVWYTLRLCMDWEQRTVDVTVVFTATAASTAGLNSPRRTHSDEVSKNVRVHEGTVRMLDVSEVTGLNSIEIFPRREMLVAYCNMLIRYEAN